MSEFEKRRENFEADLQFFLARATSGVTIEDLPAAAALADDDALEIQATSGSAKITIAQIKAAIGAGGACTCTAVPIDKILAIF